MVFIKNLLNDLSVIMFMTRIINLKWAILLIFKNVVHYQNLKDGKSFHVVARIEEKWNWVQIR